MCVVVVLGGLIYFLKLSYWSEIPEQVVSPKTKAEKQLEKAEELIKNNLQTSQKPKKDPQEQLEAAENLIKSHPKKKEEPEDFSEQFEEYNKEH